MGNLRGLPFLFMVDVMSESKRKTFKAELNFDEAIDLLLLIEHYEQQVAMNTEPRVYDDATWVEATKQKLESFIKSNWGNVTE